MAQNTDSLVSLYLRAKREGTSVEAEPSAGVESFRSQLKNLATEIQQFVPEQEKYTEPHPHPAPSSVPTQPMYTQPSRPTQTYQDFSFLDPQSLEILKKVRQHLNLGSETEALRMLLVLGFEKVQSLFKNV